MKRSVLICLVPAVFILACMEAAGSDEVGGGETGETNETGEGAETGGDTGESQTPIPVLGNGTHDIDEVVVEVLSTPQDGLNFPTDAEFKPDTRQLWVTNRADFSIVIYDQAGLVDQSVAKYQDPLGNGPHFLAKPAALAFGDNGNLATAQQEGEVTQPGDPADGSFMGPTLWTSDLPTFKGGHESHLDMLHNSPLSSGIAFDTGNAYWVYDGRHGSLTYYDFNADHGLGGTDHEDGEIYRYVDGQMGYVNSVPSHLVWDRDASRLYAADTQHNRIVVLEPETAEMGGSISPNYDGCTMRYMSGAQLTTLVDGETLEMPMSGPSGLEMFDDKLFVTDPFTGIIYAFDLDGKLLDWLDTGFPEGSLLGFTFDAEGSIYVTDAAANRLIKISAP